MLKTGGREFLRPPFLQIAAARLFSSDPPTISDPRAALKHCVDSVRLHDPESYAWCRLAPAAHRPHLFALRAFNLETTSIANLTEPSVIAIRYQWWKDGLAAALSTQSSPSPTFPPHPVLTALHALHTNVRPVRRYWLDRVVTTRERDALRDQSPPSMADLEAYAEGTASALTYSALDAAGIQDGQADHAASHLGKAIGIVAVLRGTRFHAQRRKSYLPLDLCATHGVVTESLFRGNVQPGVQDVVLQIASTAKAHADEAADLFQQNKVLQSSDMARALSLPLIGVRNYLALLEKADFDPFAPHLTRGAFGMAPFFYDWRLRWAMLTRRGL